MFGRKRRKEEREAAQRAAAAAAAAASDALAAVTTSPAPTSDARTAPVGTDDTGVDGNATATHSFLAPTPPRWTASDLQGHRSQMAERAPDTLAPSADDDSQDHPQGPGEAEADPGAPAAMDGRAADEPSTADHEPVAEHPTNGHEPDADHRTGRTGVIGERPTATAESVSDDATSGFQVVDGSPTSGSQVDDGPTPAHDGRTDGHPAAHDPGHATAHGGAVDGQPTAIDGQPTAIDGQPDGTGLGGGGGGALADRGTDHPLEAAPVDGAVATGPVSRGTGTAAGAESRPRRVRPQPVSVADVGAVYTWQTDPGPATGSPARATEGDREPAEGHGQGSSDGPDPGADLARTAEQAGDVPDHSDARADAANSSDEPRSTSTDAADRAVDEDERGTVEDLSDPPSGPVSTGVAVDPDDAARAALVESLPRPDEDTPLMAELQLDARRRIELRGRKFPRPEKTRVITVANQKGGVGKTTTTVNLAASLAQAGLHVLVLDNDPQGNASTALGIDHRAGTPSIYEVLVDGAPMHEAVQESPDVPGLFCLPATIDLSGAEIELVSMVARETRLRTALDNYLAWRTDNGLERIDYVFVDCPPSLGLLTVNAFVVAREVLIPIQCEYYALEGLSQLLKTIDLIQAHLNPQLSVSTILLTMYDARTNLAQQVAEEVRTHFPDRTLRTTVPRSVRISEAPSYGQTVMTYDGGSSGALAYLEAARELAERAEGAVTSTDTPMGATDGAVKEDQ